MFFDIKFRYTKKIMSSSKVLKLMKDKEIEFVDLRFTDPRGKLQHLTMDSTIVDDDMLNDGVFFDGSSIAVSNPQYSPSCTGICDLP